MSKKKIFISYDYDNDKSYKNLLKAWDSIGVFDFNDQSADISIDSDDSVVIQRAISAKINSAPYFLCIVGSNTYKSSWVAWEIEKAVELNRKIVAVKIKSTNTSPTELFDIGAKWALSFTESSISTAIDDA